MSPTIDLSQPNAAHIAGLATVLAGAERAARLAANLADVATQWAEMTQVGLDAARDAREAAALARAVADSAKLSPSADLIRALAADAWLAVRRALEADSRVVAAVSALGH